MESCRVIDLDSTTTEIVALQLKEILKYKEEYRDKEFKILGTVTSNVSAFAHSHELSLAWDDLMKMKESRYGTEDKIHHYGAITSWDTFPGTVNEVRLSYSRCHPSQLPRRFDIIVFRVI